MNCQSGFARQQSGMILIEALLAVLIFSLGILALVGLQATSVKQSADAKYRSEAALLANEIIGQMWVSDRTTATLQTNFNSPGGAAYANWLARVGGILPGAAANPPNIAIGADGIASVTVYWVAPNETTSPLLCSDGTPAHCYISIAQIR
jgi:type IV pilus assembly protein PilV